MKLTTEQKEHLIHWIAALKSGKYKQTRGALADKLKGGYCCLGVACEIAIQDGSSLKKKEEDYLVEYVFGSEIRFGSLPTVIQQWYGLNGQIECTLIDMNDQETKSFPEIADYLEQLLNASD